jgi:6-phosphogluconolactonase (cycloisomerase 2 family)
MEMNERMSKRWWLLGLVGLLSIGLLVACGSKYSSSSDGLLLVGSQDSSVIQTFSFNLNNGHAAGISNPATTSGQPFDIVMDPSGAYAFVILDHASIGVFKVGSGGSLSSAGSFQSFNSTSPTVVISVDECDQQTPVAVPVTAPVSPLTMAIDSTGKYLFIASTATTTTAPVTYTCNGTTSTVTATVPVPGTVSVLAIGADGTLSEVAGSPFGVPLSGTTATLVALAASPTVFPGIGINGTQNSVCQVPGNSPPTAEYLYAVDSLNYVVWEFAVDTTTGALGNPPGMSTVPSFPTGAVPTGIAVDPCDRFVYVTDSLPNKVSAYTICLTVQVPAPCPNADGSLVPVAGSPFSLSNGANGPGPLAVDPYGNNVYVVGTLSNTVSGFKIGQISGALTPLSPPTLATGLGPTSIAIRKDDNWMFVPNHGSATVSQYSITPATGALTAEAPITTDNRPWGVAVK